MQTLRIYQSACVTSVWNAIDEGHTRILYTMATGGGKTTVFAELIRACLEYRHWRVLVLAHRTELITQAYERIRDHCGLNEAQLGIEQGEVSAPPTALVVVGNIATVRNPKRLPGWTPDVIIIDEAHRSAAPSYRHVCQRYGVPEGRCLCIGCTATAKRTDKQALVAIGINGEPVEIVDRKSKKKHPADPAETVFQIHAFDFGIIDACEDGWLVEPRGTTAKTDFDLTSIQTTQNEYGESDFVASQLAEKLGDAKDQAAIRRCDEAISAWKKAGATNRPTLVYTAGVEHNNLAAERFCAAGYPAIALDGNTDSYTRHTTIEQFKHGRIPVLCNVLLFTEGTDLPNCGCILDMRPTKSWNLYVQKIGRGLRTLPGVVEGKESAQERKAAIARSAKPDCLVIDLVDNCGKHELCSLPAILDLPVDLDLQGQSVVAAKRLLDEFQEVKSSVIGERPKTFHQLQMRLAQVDLLRSSNAKTARHWAATKEGFRYMNLPAGYTATLSKNGQTNAYTLTVAHRGTTILQKEGKPRGQFRTYLGYAAGWANQEVEAHKASLPPVSRGTLARLTEKQVRCLKANRHSEAEVDAMPYKLAKHYVNKYMAAWKARAQGQEVEA